MSELKVNKKVQKSTRTIKTKTASKKENKTIKVLDVIKSYVENKGYPPTFREIMQVLNLHSTATINYHLNKLEEQGLIKRDNSKNRAIEISKNVLENITANNKNDSINNFPNYKTNNSNLINNNNENDNNMNYKYININGNNSKDCNNIITANFGYVSDNNSTKIPLLGQVAAGVPILAEENYEEVYEFSENLFNKRDELFMLTVKGESMINAGIFDKDKIVVRKQNYANNSDIVVAMINGSATVKRFYKENNRIRLQPENDFMQPIYCVDVDILGKVIGLIRNF